MNPPDRELGPLYGAHLDAMHKRLESALAEAELNGLAIFSGRARTPPRDDVPARFRSEPYFLAFVPLPRLQDAILVLCPGRKTVLIFPQNEDYWLAPADPPDGYWVEHFDIRIAKSEAEAGDLVTEAARGFAAIGDHVPAMPALGPVNPAGLLNSLDYGRAAKTPYEIACIGRANAIAARGHRAVGRDFDARSSEFDLHQTYLSATRLREHEFPYENIVAVNEHAAILHYQYLATEPPTTSATLLIDAGASAAGYAADVTRTWCNGADEFQELIESMDGLQQTICDEVGPDVDFVELNERTHRELARVLVGHGLVRGSDEEAYASGVTRLFLPHGLGHLLGLQVHDPGGWQVSPAGELRSPPVEHPHLRLTRRLEPGMTLTIEPGLYFIPALLGNATPAQRRILRFDKIERFIGYGGIRIEDDLVVESAGSRNLTREAFSWLDAN